MPAIFAELGITWTTVALVGATAASSYATFANISLAQFGILPFLTGKVGALRLSPADKVGAWKAYFHAGATWTLGAHALAAALDADAVFSASGLVRTLAAHAGALSLATVPLTLAFIHPVNAELLALADEGDKLSAEQGEQVETLLGKWQHRNAWRHGAVSLLGWAFGVAALVLDGRAQA